MLGMAIQIKLELSLQLIYYMKKIYIFSLMFLSFSSEVFAGRIINPGEIRARHKGIDQTRPRNDKIKKIKKTELGACFSESSPLSLEEQANRVYMSIKATLWSRYLQQDSDQTGVIVLSNNELIKIINSASFNPKLEVGASHDPVCGSSNCIFVDDSKQSLSETRKHFQDLGKSVKTLLTDATSMPKIKDQSIDKIVSKNFPWFGDSVKTEAVIKPILEEYKRILSPRGIVVLLANGLSRDWKSELDEQFGLHIQLASQLGFDVYPVATHAWNGLILYKK
jgi:SAM-dependent methyltransferase